MISPFFFDYGDEDSLLPRLNTGDVPCPFDFFQDLLNFLSCPAFVVADATFDIFRDFTDSFFFVLRSHLPFLYEGQNCFVFSLCFLRFRCIGPFCCCSCQPLLPSVSGLLPPLLLPLLP